MRNTVSLRDRGDAMAARLRTPGGGGCAGKHRGARPRPRSGRVLSQPGARGNRCPPPAAYREPVHHWSASNRHRDVNRPDRAERTCRQPGGCQSRCSPRRRSRDSSGSGRRSTPSTGHRIARSSTESDGRNRRPDQPLARSLTRPTPHPPRTMMRWPAIEGAGRGGQPCDTSHGNAAPTGRPGIDAWLSGDRVARSPDNHAHVCRGPTLIEIIRAGWRTPP